MNLIERDSLVVVGVMGEYPDWVGKFTTLTETWVGLQNATTYQGTVIGPCILPLSNVVIIRPATEAERIRYEHAFL